MPTVTKVGSISVGQVWRQDDGYLCQVVAFTGRRGPVWIRSYPLRPGGRPWQAVLAWFTCGLWELVK